MEIAPAPSRRLSRGVCGAAALLALLPVLMLTVLPALLGLQRYAVDDRDMQTTAADGNSAGIAPGSLLLAKVVPTSDLSVGDVVTYAPPGGRGDDALVTRRVVAVRDGTVLTRGDGLPAADPWVLRTAERPTTARMVVSIAVVGRLLSAPPAQATWLLLALPALLLGSVVLRDQHARRRALRRLGVEDVATPAGRFS